MSGTVVSRGFLVILILAAPAAAGGCTSYRVETRPVPELLEVERPGVMRVTLADDRVLELFQPSVADDSLRGHPTPTAVRRLSVPLGSIRSVAIRRFNLGKTVLLFAAIGGGVLVYDLLMGLNNTQ